MVAQCVRVFFKLVDLLLEACVSVLVFPTTSLILSLLFVLVSHVKRIMSTVATPSPDTPTIRLRFLLSPAATCGASEALPMNDPTSPVGAEPRASYHTPPRRVKTLSNSICCHLYRVFRTPAPMSDARHDFHVPDSFPRERYCSLCHTTTLLCAALPGEGSRYGSTLICVLWGRDSCPERRNHPFGRNLLRCTTRQKASSRCLSSPLCPAGYPPPRRILQRIAGSSQESHCKRPRSAHLRPRTARPRPPSLPLRAETGTY